MTRQPKVLLIYPPNQLMPIETPRPDGSLGPLYLAGELERAGIPVDILDASVGASEDSLEDTFYKVVKQTNGLIRVGMSWERIREFIAAGGYNVVGVHSNFTPQTKMALRVAQIAKEISPEILVLGGGVNCRNLLDRFLRDGWIDAICLTEGEKILLRLIQNWEQGLPIETVPGVAFWRDGRCIQNPPRSDSVYSNLDELPMPAWHKLPLDKYEKIASPHGALSGAGQRYAPIMTSRGCPFKCAYCHISLEKEESAVDVGSLRLKSIDRVMMEISVLRSLGVKKLYFEDDSLLAKKARVKDIFEKLQLAGLQMAGMNGVNLVHFSGKKIAGSDRFAPDVNYLQLLKNGGFDQIVFPVESASQRVLDKYASGKLNHSRLDVIDLVRRAREVGITCPINMMIGFPDETEEEMMSSVELGRRLVEAGSDYCTFFIPIPFPGSRLFHMAIDGGHLDADFDPDSMNWKNATMKNTKVPPERIIEIRDWAWKSVNTNEHVERRLKESAGTRWSSGAAEGS